MKLLKYRFGSLLLGLAVVAFSLWVPRPIWAQDKQEKPAQSEDAAAPEDKAGAEIEAKIKASMERQQDALAALSDPAFDHFVSLEQIYDAYTSHNADALIDAALLLAEGERTLLREHHAGITPKALLAFAAKTAGVKQEVKTLERLVKAADAAGADEIANQVRAMSKLVAQQRTISVDLGEHEELVGIIQDARLAGNPEWLNKIEEELPEGLSAKQREHVKSLISSARDSFSTEDKPDPGIEALEKISGDTRGLIPTLIRSLSSTERSHAYNVFKGSIPYSRIKVTNAIGAYDRAWTSTDGYHYYLNVGSKYSSLSSNSWRRDLLIHELTHAWQGYHSLVPVSYMLNSGYHQTVSGNAAYDYTDSQIGQNWSNFNVEQQAEIVSDWYSAGMPTSGGNNSKWLKIYVQYINGRIVPGIP